MSRFRFDGDPDDRFDDPRAIRRSRAPRRRPTRPEPDVFVDDRVPPGSSLSTYPSAAHGPSPVPAWVVTTGNAVDTDLGPIKTGKEADVHLLERRDPDSGRTCLLAAKRYRDAQHRMFHRDAGYLEGRRIRRSRETRAMANRTSLGRQLIAQQWAATEFATLGQLWSAGIPVPYPVQLDRTELLLELIGDDGVAAPRLADLDADVGELDDLWQQCVEVLCALGAAGLTHGDLSAFNVLVQDGRVVLIDLPQVVDIVVNPQGLEYLLRDCHNISAWFAKRGVAADADELRAQILASRPGP